MSLTTILTGKYLTLEQKEIYDIITKHNITSKDFKTYSGKKPFSNEYVIKVPYNLKNSGEASIIGTAFDYLARFTIDKYTHYDGREAFYSNSNNNLVKGTICFSTRDLVSRIGLGMLCDNLPRYKIFLVDQYNEKIELIEKWINDKNHLDKYDNNFEELLCICFYLARLESFFRSKIYINPIAEVPNHMYEELELLYKCFLNSGFLGKVVKKESIIIFNPKFGEYSNMCFGADGDLMVDNKMIDFKTTKINKFIKKDVQQLVGYNLLSNSYGTYLEIDELIIYKARYGEIEYTNNVIKHKIS